MSETRQIQIRFTEKTDVGEYSDALYFPLDAYNNGEITEEHIAAEKSNRITNWTEMIKNPPVVEVAELTPEEIQAQIDSVEQMVQSFEIQKQELVSLRSVRIEEIMIAEQLALEESMIDAPVDLGVRG